MFFLCLKIFTGDSFAILVCGSIVLCLTYKGWFAWHTKISFYFVKLQNCTCLLCRKSQILWDSFGIIVWENPNNTKIFSGYFRICLNIFISINQ